MENTDNLIFNEVEQKDEIINQPNISPKENNEPNNEKRGRGRPRKDGSQPKPKDDKKQPSIDDLKRAVDDREKELEAAKSILSTEEKKPENNPFAGLIDGYIVILAMNVLLPNFIKFIFKKKFQDVQISDIELNKMQQESLRPLADYVANYVTQFINPLAAFGIVVSFMYYNNAQDALNAKKK